MKPITVSTGDRFFEWTVVDPDVGRDHSGAKLVLCRCACGTLRQRRAWELKDGRAMSCGRCGKHNQTAGGVKSKEYRAWENMRRRCCNPRAKDFRYYGARGIKVDQTWVDSFDAFFSHVGPAPSRDHQIDRINNDGNYEPGNVRWATREEQMANRTNSLRITVRGVTKTAAQWAVATGLRAVTIRTRVYAEGIHDAILRAPHAVLEALGEK